MTVTDTLPTYRPVAGGETQLSEFPAAPQFGVESATPQPQMVYMAQPGSGFPSNVQAVHVIQPPGEDPNQHDLCLAIAWFVIGFIVPLVWLGGHMLWNSPNQAAKIIGRISVLLFSVLCCLVIIFVIMFVTMIADILSSN